MQSSKELGMLRPLPCGGSVGVSSATLSLWVSSVGNSSLTSSPIECMM